MAYTITPAHLGPLKTITSVAVSGVHEAHYIDRGYTATAQRVYDAATCWFKAPSPAQTGVRTVAITPNFAGDWYGDPEPRQDAPPWSFRGRTTGGILDFADATFLCQNDYPILGHQDHYVFYSFPQSIIPGDRSYVYSRSNDTPLFGLPDIQIALQNADGSDPGLIPFLDQTPHEFGDGFELMDRYLS